MKSGILTFLGLCFCLIVQAKNLDSLIAISSDKSVSIEERSEVYLNLIRGYSRTDQDTAKKFTRLLKKMADKTSNSTALYCYHFALGKSLHIYGVNDLLDTTIFHFKKALQFAKQCKNKVVLKETNVYYQLSYYFGKYNIVDSGLHYAQIAYDNATQKNDPKSVGISAVALGTAYYYGQDDFENGILYYQMADSICTETNNLEYLNYVKRTIGQVFLRSRNYNQAEKYFLESLEIYEKNNDEYNIYFTKDRLAEIDVKRKEYQKALATYKNSYAFYKSINHTYNIASTAARMAELYLFLNIPDSSISYSSIGYDLAKASGNLILEVVSQNELSSGYLMKKNYRKSFQYAYDAYQKSNVDGLKFKKSDILDNLYQSQYEMGNYKLAYKYLLEYVMLNDTISEKRQAEQSEELEKKYRTAKKEKQLALANQQKAFFKKQRWLFAGAAGLIGLFAFLFIRQRNKKKINQLQTEMAEVQLASLKSQMNPHFMFNSINSIKGLIINEAADAAADQLTRFSKLMRSTLNYSSESNISIQEEIEFIDLYSELERFKGKFPIKINFVVDPEIDPEDINIIPFLIQPFVENAFKHAFHEMEDRQPQIDIRFKKQNNLLQIEIEDNGIGVKNESASVHISKGTSLVEKRLELHNKKKNNVSITFRGKNQGTIATLEINN